MALDDLKLIGCALFQHDVCLGVGVVYTVRGLHYTLSVRGIPAVVTQRLCTGNGPDLTCNATQKNFRPVSSEAMSQGTRCRQLAEYIVLDAPLAMLCDSPSNYYSEEECTEFIASVPTSWDETVMVSGEVGEYVAIARRKGEKWYVGAITNWTPREMDLELGFITSASVMTVFHDGANADKVARDYMKEEEDFPENGRVRIKMAPGGGWAAIIK